MADFMDHEAVESDDEDISDEDTQARVKNNKKRKAVVSSDDEDDDDDDEEKAREEMKGFIADEDEEDGDDADSDVESGRRSRKHHHHHRRRRSENEEEDIDDDDRELLEENLGIKFQKKRRRIKMDSDSDDDDDETRDTGGRIQDSEDLPDIADAGGSGQEEYASEDDDVNDFIVDHDGKPIKDKRPKKKKHIFQDSARQMAEDIFGVNFDYNEFDQYDHEEADSEDYESDDEYADGERKKKKDRKKKPTTTIFELIEPSELELRHFTDLDNEIRNTDIPERMQLRATPVTSVPEGSDELEHEAEWIYKFGFVKPTVSKQDGYTRDDCLEWERKKSTVSKIQRALDFMRQQNFDIPFIAFYRKEYVEPELKINDLWRVYFMDEQWCKLQIRKRNFKTLVEKMILYQGEVVMADPEKPLPDGMRILSEKDSEQCDNIESFEELKDVYQNFLLYHGKDLSPMRELVRRKKKEAREARKLKKKIKEKKTKMITDENGEEVEVTDDEAEEEEPEEEAEEEEEEEQDFLKHATRNDLYTMCIKYGLIGMTTKFGLTPPEFGENLRDGYEVNQVEQDPSEPADVAAEFANSKFQTPEDVLSAAKYMVATQISKDPLVRKVVRDAFYERATLNVTPTKKGLKEIDENHDCYAMKYLSDKPVKTLEGTQWMKLLMAEEQKLLKINLAPEIPALTSNKTLLQEAKELYTHDAFSKSVQEWNSLRQEAVEIALKNMLYPMLRKELRLKLTKETKDGILRSCRHKLYDWIKVAPYTVTFEEEDEDDWDSSHGCRIMAIMYENDMDVASYAVSLQADGEVSDLMKLPNLLKRKNAWNERDKFEKQRDLEALRSFIVKKRPHAIVVGAVDRTAVMIQEDVQGVVNDLVADDQFPRVGVYIMDDNLAKVYANSTRAEQDYRDYPPILRQAISLGRRMQDPLVEFSQLTGPENEILCLRYHPLQDQLSEEELLQALVLEFINRTNEVGVDINECVAHPFTSNLVQFVGGLGPRKGAALLKTLRQMQSSQRLENRQQLVTLCHLGPKVFINCAGFIKIDTSSLGDSEVYVEVLDGSRIHNEAYEWARKMAVDALEYDEDEGNPANALEEILQDPEKLGELDLDAFAQELERQGFGDKSITLYDIRSELHHMYKDLREPYQAPDPEEVFNMVTKETPQTFFIGKLLQAVVVGFAHKKPQGEELDQAAPLRKGEENQWQCPFCGKDDFPELTEVWIHFDAGTCPGKAVGVKIRLDNGISGFIPMKNLSDKQVINPEERVRQGMAIMCRVTKIQPERFSVEAICKTSALVDENNEWKPAKDDYYDHDVEEKEKTKAVEKQEQQKRQTYIKRVIVHPSFYNIGYKEAEKLMAGMDQGDVIVRPSSKGEDHLTVTWKVHDGIYQHIDVKEEGKINSFSLGQSLWIAAEEFEDLDEIIARHINPMAAHARDIISYKYYKETDGGKREKADEILRQERKINATKIHYFLSASKEYPGKFMLSYLPRERPVHEYVTVTPDGYRFRKQNFESVSALMKWFKEHYRDQIPGTPNTPGGRMTRRTPYMTGTPGGGGITPGAMSMAAGTPYGTTPGFGNNVNTPYTPSGQTPFMTPYHTPGPSVTPRHSGAQTPGRSGAFSGHTPRGGGHRMTPSGRPGPPHARPRNQQPYPSPSYGGRGMVGASPAGRDAGWQAAADAWARGGKKTPRTDGQNTPRGYTGSTTPRLTPRFDDRPPQTSGGPPRTPGGPPRTPSGPPRTPKYGQGGGKKTPRSFGDATPLYDEH